MTKLRREEGGLVRMTNERAVESSNHGVGQDGIGSNAEGFAGKRILETGRQGDKETGRQAKQSKASSVGS
ncbi:hypothetical protein BOTCAL_0079g00130 [Botryotinia calthae]|uniref:Uncharacterized protein n=1 Tax=Botryotinia calthae TaxID=38488 RepID=A0A4Y8D8J3_9HELO|nr:hypothetical protein BOTCAL_0079g00130 [Botryotinia calthae]